MSDPYLIMGQDGTRLQFSGGQPLMDDGLENMAFISLFTSEGWCGNSFTDVPIGSDFEQKCNQPITKSSLIQIRNAAMRALSDPIFGKVSVVVTNPQSHWLDIKITIESTGKVLQLKRNKINWQFESSSPAHKRVTSNVPGVEGYAMEFGDGSSIEFNDGSPVYSG